MAGTATPPGPARLKVVLLTVAGFSASLNVAVTVLPTGTCVARFNGLTAVIVGGTSVLNVHVKVFAIGVPVASKTPVEIVAVYTVLAVSRAVGVSVATLLAYVTVEGTKMPPGAVS